MLDYRREISKEVHTLRLTGIWKSIEEDVGTRDLDAANVLLVRNLVEEFYDERVWGT